MLVKLCKSLYIVGHFRIFYSKPMLLPQATIVINLSYSSGLYLQAIYLRITLHFLQKYIKHRISWSYRHYQLGDC